MSVTPFSFSFSFSLEGGSQNSVLHASNHLSFNLLGLCLHGVLLNQTHTCKLVCTISIINTMRPLLKDGCWYLFVC